MPYPAPDYVSQLAPEPQGLLARAGQHLANAPSDILNDMLRMYYNAGLRTEGDQPVEVPKPYDIPEATTLGESAVDVGANLVESLPMFMTGEGAGAGLARAAEAGPVLAKMMKVGAGFAASELSESPEQAAVGGILGAGMGAAEALPGPARFAAAGAVGLGTALDAWRQGASSTHAAIAGATNTIMPLLLGGGRAKIARRVEEADSAGLALPDRVTPLQLEDAPAMRPSTEPQVDGGATNFGARGFTTNEPRPRPPIAGMLMEPQRRLQDRLPIIDVPAEAAPVSRVEGDGIAPEGSLVRDPIMTMLESRRGMGVQPPEGSLIRNPIMTQDELMAGLRSREPIATLQPDINVLPSPTSPAKPSNRLLLSSVLSHEDTTLAEKAAKKLGVEFKGVWPGTDILGFKVPNDAAHAAHGANFDVPSGTTYAQLKDKLASKINDFEVGEQKAAELKLGKYKKAPTTEQDALDKIVATLQPKAAQPKVYTLSDLQKLAKEKGVTVDDDKANAMLHVEAPDGMAWEDGYLTTLSHPYGVFGKADAIARKSAIQDAYQRLLETGSPEPVATSQPRSTEIAGELHAPTQKDIEAGGNPLNLKPALKYKNGKLVVGETGQSHMNLISERQFNAGTFPKNVTSGFVTPEGKFLNREQAAQAVRDFRANKVATLQSPSSLETTPEIRLPQGLKVGDKASAMFEGERHVGVIMGKGEGNTIRVRTAKGEILDRPFSDISQLGQRSVERPIEKSVGGLEDIEKLGTEPQGGFQKVGGGKMKLSNFGEHGHIAPELTMALARYGAAPVAGAIGGALVSEDHPIAGAVAGAAIVGSLAIGGPKLIRGLMEAHPDIKAAAGIGATTKETAKAVGSEARDLAKALVGDDNKASRAVKEHVFSSYTDRMARWIDQHFLTDVDTKRLMGKAAGQVEVLSRNMWDAVRALGKEPLSPTQRDSITKYFEGTLSHEDFSAQMDKTNIRDLAATARNSRESLQRIAIEGLGKGKLASTIEDSIGSYLTTSYKIFHDSKYFPSDASIRAAAERIAKDTGGEVKIRYEQLHDYLHEIKANRGLWRGSSSKKGASLDALLSRAEGLTPEFREMLGEYTDPVHRMAATSLKLVNGARSAAFMDEMVSGVGKNGINFVLSDTELSAHRARLASIIEHGSAEARNEAVATLQQLDKYTYVPLEGSKGSVSGKWVPRQMRDQLATYDSAQTAFRTPVAQVFANATNLIKYGHTVLSPLQFTRQVFSMPMLGLMAKTGPEHWIKAFNILRDTSEEGLAYRDKLIRLGIWGGDTVGGMLHKDMAAMLTGDLDAKLHNSVLKQGLHKWEQIYRAPDLMTRIAAYEKAMVDATEKLGLTGEAAENYAIDYTNRYTVNYAAAPPGIQLMRQLPFVNQYLTFAYEVARITKNLTQDVIKQRDMHAAGILVGMASAPFIIQKMSEAQLSEKDQKDWELVKSLAPEYSRMNFKFVHGRKSNGDFSYTDFTPLLIHDHWLKSVRAAMHGDIGALNAEDPVFGWENTPLLNVATNQIAGVDRHSHERLDTFGSRLDSLRRDIAPTLLGGTDVDKFVAALTPNADGTMGITNARSGASNSVWGILSSYVTATRTYNVRPSALIKSAMSDSHNEVLNQQMLLRRVINTNAAPEVKQRAIQRYQQNVKDIVATLQLKINPPDTLAALSNSQGGR